MNIIYLLIVILVPIIPAYLLFKKLKSSAEAAGPISPIKEFSVKFGGAFAGYFPIFLLLYFKLPNSFKEEAKKCEFWEITGTIRDAVTKKTIQNSDAELKLNLEPFSRVNKTGTFTLYLVPIPTPLGVDKLNYELQIEDENDIYFSNDAIKLDDFRKESSGRQIILPDSFLMLSKKPTVPTDTIPEN